MKNKVQKVKRARTIPPFETGQIWQMEGSQIEIGLTGKRLVHYRHYKPMAKRPSIQLSAKEVLEKFLKNNDAVLLPPAALRAAEGSRASEPGRVAR